ncbi:MAG: SulP family inorganic anion transporter [Gammaproteobacteria bacterium]
MAPLGARPAHRHDLSAEWLARDISAGLVPTAMLVPVGIAYAEASGILAGIYGPYATIVPLLAYALFGPELDSGVPIAGFLLVALIIAVVVPLSGGDPAGRLSLSLGSAM